MSLLICSSCAFLYRLSSNPTWLSDGKTNFPRIHPRLTHLRKISLVLLFALSLILVGITIYRVQGVVNRDYSQQFRSLLASLEILAAAAVSNALVLGSFVRDRGTKKQRFRFGSTGGNSTLDRQTTAPHRVLTARHWGSDADLVGDIGMNLGPDLIHKEDDMPRLAPVAVTQRKGSSALPPEPLDRKWDFPHRKSVETNGTDETDIKSPQHLRDSQPSPSEVPATPKGMSFFDVGGLLGGSDDLRMNSRQHQHQPSLNPSPSRPPNSQSTQQINPPTGGGHARKGSHALLQDIGGLLDPSPQTTTPQPAPPRPEPSTAHSGLIEALQSEPPSSMRRAQASQPPQQQRQRPRRGSPGLQDVGGLLS